MSAWISHSAMLLAAALTGGCVVAPPVDPRPVLEQLAAYGRHDVRDLRAMFQAALCARLETQPGRCEDALTPMADGFAPAHVALVAEASIRYQVVIVPGLFAECLPPPARPLTDAAERLREHGFVVYELVVPGRGGVTENGEVLARQIGDLPPAPEPLIVFGYSKGLIDVLDALVQRPELQRRVAAVVGVAGAAYGSWLVDSLEGLYRFALMRLSLAYCQAGDGSELLDLSPQARAQWWARNESALSVPRYSIVAIPQEARVSPLLSFHHRWLSRFDARNDGQLLWRDAVMGSAGLLGFVNADHWGIAMSIGKVFPWLSPWIVDELPRAAMLLAAIDVIAADLANQGRQSRVSVP